MSILRFTSGFNVLWNPDQDIHVLQRALDHYVRIEEDPGLESTYHMNVDFSTGPVRLALHELALIECSDVEPTLFIEDEVTGERHRLIMVATGRVARPDAQRPRSQHTTAPAADIAVPERPTHVTINTRRGPVEITSARDLPVLRRWFEDGHVIDGEMIAMPSTDAIIELPDAGPVRIEANELRRLAAALINARQIEAGVPLRAIANVDGQDYGQRSNETLPDYEQRVIQDMMLRRGRDLMRERNMTPEQAATEVQRMLEQNGVERMAADMSMMRQPTPEVEAQLAQLTRGDQAILAQAIARYYLDDERSERGQRLIERVGLTPAMIRWFNMQMVAGHDRIPVKEKGPSLLEAWRD